MFRSLAVDGSILAEPRPVQIQAVERLELLGGHRRHHEVRQQEQRVATLRENLGVRKKPRGCDEKIEKKVEQVETNQAK